MASRIAAREALESNFIVVFPSSIPSSPQSSERSTETGASLHRVYISSSTWVPVAWSPIAKMRGNGHSLSIVPPAATIARKHLVNLCDCWFAGVFGCQPSGKIRRPPIRSPPRVSVVQPAIPRTGLAVGHPANHICPDTFRVKFTGLDTSDWFDVARQTFLQPMLIIRERG